MFIKDLVMWHHYNVILENSDITTHPWLLSDNLNRLSANVIWNILGLNIKGKINKIAIKYIMLNLITIHINKKHLPLFHDFFLFQSWQTN